jgi:2-phospho-L-lactate guanylyltransferase
LISHADAVVPVKKLSESKTRLSQTLSLSNRQKLVLVMLEDVLASLSDADLIDQVAVLTPDRQVADRAEDLGARIMMDQTNGGINESIAMVTEYEIRERRGMPLLILPVDVPLVKPTTIDDIIRKVGKPNHDLVVISPSTVRGTNALLRNPPDAIPTHYGVDSFDAHVAEATARNVHVEVHRSEDLEIDVDTPSDLYEIIRKGNSTRTSRFLRSIL